MVTFSFQAVVQRESKGSWVGRVNYKIQERVFHLFWETKGSFHPFSAIYFERADYIVCTANCVLSTLVTVIAVVLKSREQLVALSVASFNARFIFYTGPHLSISRMKFISSRRLINCSIE